MGEKPEIFGRRPVQQPSGPRCHQRERDPSRRIADGTGNDPARSGRRPPSAGPQPSRHGRSNGRGLNVANSARSNGPGRDCSDHRHRRANLGIGVGSAGPVMSAPAFVQQCRPDSPNRPLQPMDRPRIAGRVRGGVGQRLFQAEATRSDRDPGVRPRRITVRSESSFQSEPLGHSRMFDSFPNPPAGASSGCPGRAARSNPKHLDTRRRRPPDRLRAQLQPRGGP